MSDENGNGGKNIIDLAGARKRQKVTARDKTARAGGSSGRAGGWGGLGASGGKSPGKSPRKLRVWQWLQFVGFLLVTAYLMTLCSG